MDHDLFMLVFQCFTQQRDQPRKVFSDNRTSFVKVEQVLRANMASNNMKVIAKNFENPKMKWQFYSPSSPHLGGGRWKCLVKFIMYAFYAVPHHKPLNDQLLMKFCERDPKYYLFKTSHMPKNFYWLKKFLSVYN